MSAPAIDVGRPTLRIRGTPYPVLLPTIRDPRLHLAAVIVSLQVLGQVAFHFRLSIAQILVALITCAVLEVSIAFRQRRVIMWPASALLTGNGVAFILRVPGTQHGDWWSLRGWWIFAGTAAVALLSKYVIRFRGRHVFNPSNFGLVLCFLVLGSDRADPLEFWWGPMSPWLALALAIIVAGGFAILLRIGLLGVAVGFWLAFVTGIGVLAASGHGMTANWHLGPVSDGYFWWVLAFSPEILVFLFFMITDPKTAPEGRATRLVYAVSVGLLATLLIAPQTTEFGAKVAVLGALAIVCAVRPLLAWLLPRAGSAGAPSWRLRPAGRRRLTAGAATLAAVAGFAGLVVLAGIPARSSSAAAAPLTGTERLPRVTVVPSQGVASQLSSRTARQIARDVVVDLRVESDALRLRDVQRAALGAGGAWLVDLRRQVRRAAGRPITVPSYRAERMSVTLRPGDGQSPPRILATLDGMEELAVYRGLPPKLESRHAATPFRRYLEVALQPGRYVIVRSGEGTVPAPVTAPLPVGPTPVRPTGSLGAVRLQDVAPQVGLGFRQGAFWFGVSTDLPAMMGGGLCWLDYDNDGWLDLFVVNSYANSDIGRWEERGGLPRSALFHNVRGRFVNVSRPSGADLAVRGEGCVAADFNGDGYTDLYVTTDSQDRLLWNNGDSTFTEGASAAGITSFGWHAGAAVADVNGDDRPDLFVAGYTDTNAPVSTSTAGFPSNFEGVRDLFYLNKGPDGKGRSRFREVGVQAGLEAAAGRFSHGLGAVFTDYDGDGRPDLYVANDEDPNQLYENVPWPGGAAADPAGLGFRFEERGAAEGVDDRYAGMGIAAADFDGDGRRDLFVTNSRREPHGVFRRRPEGAAGPSFADGRTDFRSAFGASSTGWGASWVDLALDGSPDLVLANGGIPVTNLAKDAGQIQILQNVSAQGTARQFANVGDLGGPRGSPRVNGRGLAAADYDNNGTEDIAVNSIGGPLVLLRNTGAAGHWLEVKLTRFSPGAVVTVLLPGGRRLVREVHAGSSYLSSEDPRVHFGLGAATRVTELIVRFPGVGATRLSGVAADRVVLVKPPQSVAARRVTVSPTSYLLTNCVRAPARGRSVARIWDGAALAGQRDDAPTTQARNLFHLSAAMWDAWAAYDPKADGYFLSEKQTAPDALGAREAAISYAAYRLLLWRSSYGADVRRTFDRLTATMRSLCYRPDFVTRRGDSPAALGNRIGAAAIAYGLSDGSLERQHYVDSTYTPVNEPLVVTQPGTTMHDPTFWQPLAFGRIVIQGGLAIPAKVQTFVGSQWGHVHGFALPASAKGLPVDPGPPPVGTSTSASYRRTALEVIRRSGELSSSQGQSATERTIAGSRVDGPGRWNEIANAASDAPGLLSRTGRSASERLRWDVKLYFALNGALHDSAIAVWGAKRAYQPARPISMIRYLAFQGQSSDPKQPSYAAHGLPLVPGSIELITRGSSGPRGRHAGLAGHVGEVAIRSARGWVLGTEWRPYEPTPPSPGGVSAVSAFARAAAEVLTAATGSRAVPAGASALGRLTRTAVAPRWKTWDQAARQAGLAGVQGGIDTPAGDVAGRTIGAVVGKKAWQLAARYGGGAVR